MEGWVLLYWLRRRRSPAAIESNVPFAIASCEADGETVEVGEGAMSVDVRPSAGKVRLFLQRV